MLSTKLSNVNDMCTSRKTKNILRAKEGIFKDIYTGGASKSTELES